MKFTDWHHLLGITLTDFFTDTAYMVELEKDLSMKKQFLDVVIIEKKEGKMPEDLPDGLENMAKHNLLSYKSFHEPFDDWSADELIGHFVNYRKQVSPSLKKLLPKEDFRLYAVCTRFPEKLKKEAVLNQVKNGVYNFRWGSRDIRLIVTSQIAEEKQNAMWLMFSAVWDRAWYGFSNYSGKRDEMSSVIECLLTGYEKERIITMPYTIEDFRKEMKQRTLKLLTPEEVAKAFPAQEICGVFSAEERLRGLPAEEIFRAFSPEEIEAYLRKIKRKAKPKKKG